MIRLPDANGTGTSTASSASNPRLPVLDGIRGLAILLVMEHHFWGFAFGIRGQVPTLAIDRHIADLITVGWSGVDLFFVLSGFLITGILYDAKAGNGYFRSFYARRFLRIFPLYYVFLFFVIFLLPHIGLLETSDAIPSIRDDQWWFWTYLVNVWASFWTFNPDLPIVHTHFWSLAVEEQFYLVWPFVVLLLDRRRLMFACVAMIIGALAFRMYLTTDAAMSWATLSAPSVLTPARMDTLAAGALLALAARGSREELRAMARWAPAVGGGSLLVLAVMFVREDGLTQFSQTVQTIGFTAFVGLFASLLALVLVAPPGSVLERIFSNPVLTFFGRYAYGLYVIHLLLLFELAIRFNRYDWLRSAWGSQIPMNIIFSAVCTALAVAIAWCSWRFFESQFLKLKKYVPYGRAVRAAPPPATEDVPPSDRATIPAP